VSSIFNVLKVPASTSIVLEAIVAAVVGMVA
jgi:hypothetical protein